MSLIWKDETNADDLWTKAELLNNTYEPGSYPLNVSTEVKPLLTKSQSGTVATHHFMVLEKTPTSITMRGCVGPRQDPIKPQTVDNLIRLEVNLDSSSHTVDFKLKAITLDGVTETPVEDPFGGFPGMLHLTYSKALVEAAVAHCAA